jgi:hypothetical protein
MPPNTSDQELIKKLLEENHRLLEDNNKLLHKMRRAAQWGMVFRLIWLVVIFGAPFYFYMNYILPNMGTIQKNIGILDQLNVGNSQMQEWYKHLAE